jgi:K+-sensing histidine kinase KdpD
MDVLAVDRITDEFHALAEVAKTLTSPLPLPELLDHALDCIHKIIPPAEVGAVMLWDEPAGLFRPAASQGFNPQAFKHIGLRQGEAITGKVFDRGKLSLLCSQEEVEEAMLDMRPANRTAFSAALGSGVLPKCILAAPLMVGKTKYGVLVLQTITGEVVFTPKDIPFVQMITDLLAMAIERAFLEEKADEVRQAREAERMRSDLMATLSHELRLPLTAIKGYSTALLLSEVGWSIEKQREFLQLIEDACENMEVMLKNILDSSLMDVSQINLELQPVRIQHLAREIVTEFQHRSESHHFIVDIPGNFPIVDADPHWIRQVFRNILDNAIKYSPESGLIVLRGEIRTQDVVISVADQGVGISPEDQIPLFEKYFRGRSSAGYHIPGTGLGLPVARAIIERHGGRIWVESKLGEGTTLYFSLPKAKEILPEFDL